MSEIELKQMTRYVALGDSISIDLYPALDLAARRGIAPPDGVGAASLLYRNADWLWPEFAGVDLVNHAPGIQLVDLTADGAITDDVLDRQIPSLPPDDRRATLVTITAGGNDLLWLVGSEHEEGDRMLTRIIDNLRAIVHSVARHYERATIILGSVYDPSDGTGELGEETWLFGDQASRARLWRWLGTYNQAVQTIAAEASCRFADICGHFLGHGVSVPDPAERWYWDASIIEPSARGASEVRRLWLRCLGLEV
jgi:lysophospholipase L1-like esterase